MCAPIEPGFFWWSMNLLFVCSRNQWRSPTAEAVFKNDPVHRARSAGTSKAARVRVTEKLLQWADIIFVMEKRHLDLLKTQFRIEKKVVVLNIADDYQFMDPELIEMIKLAVAPHLPS